METINININSSDLNASLVDLLVASRIEQVKNRAMIEVLLNMLPAQQVTGFSEKSEDNSAAPEQEPALLSETEEQPVAEAEDTSTDPEAPAAHG